MPINSRFELLIFDLDGTLLDTRQDLTDAVNYALRKLGFAELDRDTVTSYVGDGVRKLLERTLNHPEDEILMRGRSYFIEYYSDHLADHTRPYPGVVEMLQTLSGKRLAVISNKSQEFTVPLLETLHLAHYFEIIIGGNAGYPAKPDPAAVKAVLEKTGVPTDKALITGDSPNDILAGRAAGISTCAALYGYRPQSELMELKPDFSIRQAAELIEILEKGD